MRTPARSFVQPARDVDGRDLVDGMIVNNIPIDVVKAMGAEVVIAIDIGTRDLGAQIQPPDVVLVTVLLGVR